MQINSEEEWNLVLKPKSGLFEFNFKEIYQYRDLLLMFVKRDIVVVYKQTILGPLWFFVQPIMTTLIYTFIFSNIAKIPIEGSSLPYFIFQVLLCGIILPTVLIKHLILFLKMLIFLVRFIFPDLLYQFQKFCQDL